MSKLDNPFGQEVSVLLAERKKELFSLKTALDIGCAYGANSFFLASAGLKVDAIDKALPEDIEKHPNVNFENISVLDFSFDKKYDVIMAINILQFLYPKEREDILNKMYDSLNKNGWMFIQSFTSEDNGVQKGLFKSHFEKDELQNWAKSKKITIQSYSEKIISDDHAPLGKHTHGVVELVGTKA